MKIPPYISTLIPIIFSYIPPLMVFKFYNSRIKGRKSPLNIELLRSPGDSIQEQIIDINDDIVLYLFLMPVIPIIIYSAFLPNLVSQGKIPATVMILSVSTALLITFYLGMKIYLLMQKKNKLRLGLECEKAIGQALSGLMKYGFHVYHDLQAGDFNIDHIAIGPTGVFSIETKGRSKAAKTGNSNWKVDFDGKKLIFPGWEETKPIDQAVNQARWLKQFIQKSTAEQIKVTPVIALPGWYITRKAKSEILTINGKNIDFMAQGARVLTDKQIQSISFQLKKMCLDNSPRSYQKIVVQ